MNPFATAFLMVNSIAIFLLPRRKAFLPLLLGATYMTLGQGIKVGPFHFPIIRLIIGAGLVRVMIRQEKIAGRFNELDWFMISWGMWSLISSFFHESLRTALIFRLGLVYNIWGIYFLMRVFLESMDEVVKLGKVLGILIVPVAIEMIHEKLFHYNIFSVFGGVGIHPAMRHGSVRAQGPFGHSILAGTIGAVTLPIIIGCWRYYRYYAVLGVLGCLTMIATCKSSGPILSMLVGLAALLMWNYRERMRLLRWLALVGYILLDILMKAPPYYLMARVDLAGGSTGWHRAALIQSAIEHISEWWLAGTDYTRHWMATGVSWSSNHTDITNYYIYMGVIGGVPLMIFLILMFAKGFSYVGHVLRERSDLSNQEQFVIWSLGSSLFAHAATCISVSYFDQSFVFLFLVLAGISSIWSTTSPR